MEPTEYTPKPGEKVSTDPTQIRALAHPTRLALLDFLGTVAQATATECAEAIGESVASCSFHLRSLAQHGFVEPGEPSGRQKPWKKVYGSFSQVIDPDEPGGADAVAAMGALSIRREAERLQDFMAQLPSFTTEDGNRNVVTTSSFYATDAEMADVREVLLGLAERFAGRGQEPDSRPEGSRRVHLFGALTLDVADARRKDRS
ncbi:hypothetical protein BJH93_05025 [Kocuria polaris]|nr:hypothetical protein [Kocuria polaris]